MQSVSTNSNKRPQTMEALTHKLELGRHILERDEGSSLNDSFDEDGVFDDTRH